MPTDPTPTPPPPPDVVAWVRHANRRWIVHQGLGRNAEAYLDHLARTDPPRLERSCRRAHRMVRQSGALTDPKPWFYSGLFSLATPGEAQQYLADHWLVATATSRLPTPPAPHPPSGRISPATQELIERLREGLQRLERESPPAQ